MTTCDSHAPLLADHIITEIVKSGGKNLYDKYIKVKVQPFTA
jgi:hypothetical protein